MNSTDRLHQARLNEWATKISEQVASGLTPENGVLETTLPFTSTITGNIYSRRRL